jgi:hypothetical protein
MLDPLPFDEVKVTAKGQAESSSYEIKEAGPLAFWRILVEGNPLWLSHMAVNLRVYPLIPAFAWAFEKGKDESNHIHISSKGIPVLVKLEFHVIDESSQVLWDSLKRFDIKLVWPFPASKFLQQL